MTTEKPNPLRGYREVQDTKKEMPVDPKRFQEELNKVQESDEAQKRQQRNLKKTEEESEEEAVEAPIEASEDLFSGFMHGSEGTSMMTPQTPQNLRATEAPSSSSTFTIEEEEPSSTAKTPGILPATSKDSSLLDGALPVPLTGEISAQPTDDLFPEEGSFITTSDTFEAPLSSQTQPSSQQEPSQPEKKEATTSSTSPQRVKKKTHEDTSLLGKKAPSAAHKLKQKKETPAAPIKLQKQAAPAKPKKAEALPKTPKTATPPKPSAKPQPAKPLEKPLHTPLEKPPATTPSASLPKALPPTVKDKLHEKTPSEGRALAQELTKQATRTQSDNTSRDHSKSKEDKKEADVIAASTAAVTPVTPFHIPDTSQAAPAYATLSPDVYEMFEKMVGVMTIEMTKGVTTTTVTINKKDSIFNGAKITLDHYSTAPNAFNVTIAAAPEAQEIINTNLASLAAAFEQSKLSFQVNLRRPILLEEHQAISRKRKAGEDEKEGKKKKK